MNKKELQSIDYIKERADENLAKTKSVFLYRRELAIRFALRRKEFTQKKLAKRLKMTESYISKLFPPLTTISRVTYLSRDIRIARVLTPLRSANS